MSLINQDLANEKFYNPSTRKIRAGGQLVGCSQHVNFGTESCISKNVHRSAQSAIPCMRGVSKIVFCRNRFKYVLESSNIQGTLLSSGIFC